MYFIQVTKIESKWLLEVVPHYYKPKELENLTNKKMLKVTGRAQPDGTNLNTEVYTISF